MCLNLASWLTPNIRFKHHAFSRRSLKTAFKTNPYYRKNLPDFNPKSIEQKYQEQIDTILDNLKENNLIIRISIVDLPVFECRSIEFIGSVLKRLIDKAATKRGLDIEPTVELVNSKIKWEIH